MALPVHLEVNTKGMDFAVHLTGNSSSEGVETVELLVPLAVSTKGMGCKSNDYKQLFRGGGSSGTSCPSGTQYKGNGFCRSN